MGFLKGFSIAMGANIFVFVLSFLNNKIIYISLSKADNGYFRLFQQSVLFLALFTGDWLRLSNLNIAGEKKENIPWLSANGLWFGFSVFCFLGINIFIFKNYLNHLFYGFSWVQLILLVFLGSLFIVRNNLQSLLLVNHRMVSYSLTYIFWIVIFVGLNIFFRVAGLFTLGNVLYAFAISTIGCTLWAFGANSRLNGNSFKPSTPLFIKSSKLGLKAWIAVVGMFLMLQIHLFIIKPLSGNDIRGLELVAVYSICYNFFVLFQHGADVAGTVLFSHVVQQDRHKSAALTAKVSRITVLLSVIMVIFAAFAAKFIILLISDSRYLSAYIPLLIILPGVVAVNAGSVINSYFWGRGYPIKIIIAPYIATILGTAIDIALIPVYGVCGATISFSLMSLGWFIFIVIIFTKENGLNAGDVIFPKISDINNILSRTKAFFERVTF